MPIFYAGLLDKPSITTDHACAICGRYATNYHHIVPRSVGGKNGPVVRLCGSGTTGCHGMAESKMLHFRWRNGWEYLMTAKPMRYEIALEEEGWKRVSVNTME